MNNEPAVSAESLNAALRAERAAVPPEPPAPAQPLPSLGARLHAQWALSDPASLDDLPRLRPFARVPLLGGLLSFVRELGSALWLLSRRRSLIMQQVRFNQSVADAVIYLQDLAEIGTRLDGELQAWKADVGALDASLAAQSDDLRARADHLDARIDRIEARLAALERTLAAGRAAS